MDTEFEKELAAAEYTLDNLKDYNRAYNNFEQISALHPESCRCWFGMLRAVTQDFKSCDVPMEQIERLTNHALHTAAENEHDTIRAQVRAHLENLKRQKSDECEKAEAANAKCHAKTERIPILANKIEMLNKEIILNTEKSRWGILSILWSALFGTYGLFMILMNLGNTEPIFVKIFSTLFCSIYLWVAAIPFFLKKRRSKKAAEMIQQKNKLEEEYNNILRSDFVSDEELQQMQSELAAIDRLLLNL